MSRRKIRRPRGRSLRDRITVATLEHIRERGIRAQPGAVVFATPCVHKGERVKGLCEVDVRRLSPKLRSRIRAQLGGRARSALEVADSGRAVVVVAEDLRGRLRVSVLPSGPLFRDDARRTA